jgi:hypothetical protein
MDKSLEETLALAEAARLRRVVDRLRSLAASTTAELESNVSGSYLEPLSTLDPPAEC